MSGTDWGAFADKVQLALENSDTGRRGDRLPTI
jgi:hypothetical protein